MEFEQRRNILYSMAYDGCFYRISHDDFVYYTDSLSPSALTWMIGDRRAGQENELGIPLGVVDNWFFVLKENIIQKAKLTYDRSDMIDFVQIESSVKNHFNWHCVHYFIERDDDPDVSFAFSINQDYRSNCGIKFNISIDGVRKFNRFHVHNNFLFGISDHGVNSTIRRYESNSYQYLEKRIPTVHDRSVIFNHWIFYSTVEGHLVAVNMNDLSYEIIKTNLDWGARIVAIDENGMVNVQSLWDGPRWEVHLLTGKLPDEYINRDDDDNEDMDKLIDTNKKRKHISDKSQKKTTDKRKRQTI